jgi:hypothetical protein
MRNAYQQKVQRLEENEHIPCGENYERLRRLGMQPFSFYWKDKARALHQRPLMYIDVNVGNGRSGRISVREGDDLHVLSRNFARKYHLDREKAIELEELLRQAYYANTRGASPPSTTQPAVPSSWAPVSSDCLPDYVPTFSRTEVERHELPTTPVEQSPPCEQKPDSGMVEDPELSFGGDLRHVDFQVALSQSSPPPRRHQDNITRAVEGTVEAIQETPLATFLDDGEEAEPNERSAEQACEMDPHELSFDQRRSLFEKSQVAYASEVPDIDALRMVSESPR